MHSCACAITPNLWCKANAFWCGFVAVPHRAHLAALEAPLLFLVRLLAHLAALEAPLQCQVPPLARQAGLAVPLLFLAHLLAHLVALEAHLLSPVRLPAALAAQEDPLPQAIVTCNARVSR